MTPQEQIKAGAEAAAELFDEQSRDSKDYDKRVQRVYGYINGYIAGATAEHGRAQVLVDGLRYIQKYYDTIDISLSIHCTSLIKEYEQCKGKEVKG